MADFINTADIIGDDEMCDQIIMRTVTEYKENRVTNVGQYAFYGCTALTAVDIPNVIQIGDSAFYGCKGMTELNTPNVETIGRNAFKEMWGVKKMVFPKVKSIAQYSECFADGRFGNRQHIIDFYILESIGYQGVSHANPVAFIIRNTNKVCTLGQVPYNWGNAYIYVPKTMADGSDGVAAYEAATNWSSFAGRIRAIEDYSVDGTVTGDLDETKI